MIRKEDLERHLKFQSEILDFSEVILEKYRRVYMKVYPIGTSRYWSFQSQTKGLSFHVVDNWNITYQGIEYGEMGSSDQEYYFTLPAEYLFIYDLEAWEVQLEKELTEQKAKEDAYAAEKANLVQQTAEEKEREQYLLLKAKFDKPLDGNL